MTFDEWLEKSTKRHEALTHGVELLLRSQQESQRKFDSRFERLLAIVEHEVGSAKELRETAQHNEWRTKIED